MPKKKPTYCEDSARDPEDAWIFDSLVGFLRGPVWHVPVMSFIEQKSLIFEPETTEDPNDEEYKKIHEEYKQLVDFMLGSYMDDIGISPQQFQKACGAALGNVKKQFNHNVFEQIWAADDFSVFKRMMIQKNIELQLQALELLQTKYGVLPESLKPNKKVKSAVKRADSSSEEEDQEDRELKVMAEVKKKSLEEHQAASSDMNKEKRDIELAIARSMIDHQRLEGEKKSQEELMEQQMKKLTTNSSSSAPPDEEKRPIVSGDQGAGPQPQEIDPLELKKRTDYLKAQRDKLLAMKRAEREKQLEAVEKTQSRARPKSARAARSIMSGKPAAADEKIDPQTLKARKALAEKLKAEVIGKS